jgi:hypothetical protein
MKVSLQMDQMLHVPLHATVSMTIIRPYRTGGLGFAENKERQSGTLTVFLISDVEMYYINRLKAYQEKLRQKRDLPTTTADLLWWHRLGMGTHYISAGLIGAFLVNWMLRIRARLRTSERA